MVKIDTISNFNNALAEIDKIKQLMFQFIRNQLNESIRHKFISFDENNYFEIVGIGSISAGMPNDCIDIDNVFAIVLYGIKIKLDFSAGNDIEDNQQLSILAHIENDKIVFYDKSYQLLEWDEFEKILHKFNISDYALEKFKNRQNIIK